MIDLTTTSTLLLDGLRDAGNARDWGEFDRRYRPILINVARRMGVGEHEAADLAQETMVDFLKSYREGRYKREEGRLRSWLLGIQRRKLIDLRRKKARRGLERGESAIDAEVTEEEMLKTWVEERRSRLLADAVESLREESKTDDRTVDAFELVAIRGMRASAVAEQLGMTVDDVYAAKSRCLKRVRAIIERLETAYDDA